jgi:hypothetical protein
MAFYGSFLVKNYEEFYIIERIGALKILKEITFEIKK